MKVVISLAVLLLAAGCLQSEELDVRILREQGEPAILILEDINYYSDETNPAEITKDFEKLISNWRSKEALNDNKSEGFAIKARELFARDGKIVFRQTGIIQDLASVDEFRMEPSRIIWTDDDEKEEIVETNGKILATSPPSVEWSRDASEFHFKLRRPLGESFKTSQPQMMQLLTDYLASHGTAQGTKQ